MYVPTASGSISSLAVTVAVPDKSSAVALESTYVSPSSKVAGLSPRTVIVEFPTFEDAKKCYNSDEYQKAHDILKGSVKRNLQIIAGI